MGIRQAFSKVARKVGTGLCILSLVFMGACGYPSHQLGVEAGLQGTTQVEVMFEGAEAQNHLTIPGSALQSENHYRYEGSVTVDGNVPARTEITVTDGRLVVTGGVGDGSEISVTMPQSTHQEKYSYSTVIMVGKVPVTQWHTGYRTVVDGLAHPQDTNPAVRVDGAIGNDVTIRANGGIEAAAWGTKFDATTGYGRPLVQTTQAQAPAPAARAPQPGT